MNVGVVGAGRAGTAIAVMLRRAGHRIVAVSGRSPTRERAATYLPGVPVLDPARVVRAADVVLLGVPDDLIQVIADDLAESGAFRDGQLVAHLSGATPLSVLDGARRAGARRSGIHPLQTFADVDSAIERIPGSTVAVAADSEDDYVVAERLAADLLGEPFRLEAPNRGTYHAGAVFASNYLVVLSEIAQRLLAHAGVPDPERALVHLQEATLANVSRLGPAEALTGPAVRGDATTILRNLESLSEDAPWALPSYLELARLALDLSTAGDPSAAERRRRVEEVLALWS